MKLTKILSAIAIMLITVLPLSAQHKGAKSEDRAKWEAEMLQYKHDVLAKELGLKDEQKVQFFALYDALDRDRRALYAKTRQTHNALKNKANVTDVQYVEAAKLDYTTSVNVANLELKYFNEYQKVLTPKQLFKLKRAEGKIMERLREQAMKSSKKEK